MLVVKFGKEVEEWMFQHDNGLKHTSKSKVRWFNDHAHTILQHESYRTSLEQSGPTPLTL